MKTDSSDMIKIKVAVLDQSMSDYVKLQHHKYRSKKYLEESFLYSYCMFWHDDYTFLHFFNEDGTNQSTLDFIRSAMQRNVKNLEPMRKHLKEKSIAFWKNKYMKTFTIPPYIVFQGEVWNLLTGSEKIDHSSKEIFFDKKAENAEERLIYMFVLLINDEFDLKLKKKQIERLNESFFEFLKMNKLYL